MLIFSHNGKKYIFIHIPKCAGKFYRKFISNNCTVTRRFWNIKDGIDQAHITQDHAKKIIKDFNQREIVTVVRNPYDRIISAFFYKNPDKNINDLNKFIQCELPTLLSKGNKPDNVHYIQQNAFINKNAKIIRYENIVHDTKQIFDLELNNYEFKKYDVRTYLTQLNILIINYIYKKDFKKFKYPIIQVK